MNNYASNSYFGDGGPATLTASLLARKGEALPAVDAEAHEGVDLVLQGARDAQADRPANQNQDFDRAAEAEFHPIADDAPAAPRRRPSAKVLRLPAPARAGEAVNAAQDRPEPRSPEQSAPVHGLMGFDQSLAEQERASEAVQEKASIEAEGVDLSALDRTARVTFRLPVRELIRLRRAARLFDTTSQKMILEALSDYLDDGLEHKMTEADCADELAALLAAAKS